MSAACGAPSQAVVCTDLAIYLLLLYMTNVSVTRGQLLEIITRMKAWVIDLRAHGVGCARIGREESFYC
jgi:hypothetical protein